MALNNTNTLNDTRYTDASITSAIRRDIGALPSPGPEYDYIVSVFVKVMKDKGAAKNFTEALYRVAATTESNVITLLESLDITNEITLSASMAYYLNGINSPATLYGVQNPVLPNYYAGRNVLS